MPTANEDAEKTPITVVTGFLGAGKTTLVNYILKEQSTWKIAVIENEFGEISIDDGLVADSMQDPEDIITMDNGCVCCSLRADLVRTLGMLAKRRADFDAILLETTGVADPAPIIYTMQTNPKLFDEYTIDSIVCLADCKHLMQHLDDKELNEQGVNQAMQQIAFSDKILLNKVDLVTEEEKAALKKRLKTLNNFATMIETKQSRVPLEQILKTGSFGMESILAVDESFFEDQTLQKTDSSPNSIQSVGIQFKGNLHSSYFNGYMMDLLKKRAADLYRLKGVLSFHGQGNTKFVFHGVHEQINFGPSQKPWQPNEERVNKFVFIGKALDPVEMKKNMMECLHDGG